MQGKTNILNLIRILNKNNDLSKKVALIGGLGVFLSMWVVGWCPVCVGLSGWFFALFRRAEVSPW